MNSSSQNADKYSASFGKNRKGTKTNKHTNFQFSENDFPEMNIVKKPNTDNTKSNSSIDYGTSITWKQDTDISDSNTISNEMFFEQKGWIVLTPETVKNGILNDMIYKRDTRSEKEKWDDYIKGLSNEEYSIHVNKTFDKLVELHEKRKEEFIEVHGYEYYAQMYLSPNPIIFDDDEDSESIENDDEINEDIEL